MQPERGHKHSSSSTFGRALSPVLITSFLTPEARFHRASRFSLQRLLSFWMWTVLTVTDRWSQQCYVFAVWKVLPTVFIRAAVQGARGDGSVSCSICSQQTEQVKGDTPPTSRSGGGGQDDQSHIFTHKTWGLSLRLCLHEDLHFKMSYSCDNGLFLRGCFQVVLVESSVRDENS